MFKNEGVAGEILAQKIIYTGPIFKLSKQKIKTPDGLTVDRDLILHQDAVTVLAFTPDQHVLINTEYRVGVNAESLSLPAGLINEGETPVMAAKRELQEETGFQAHQIEVMTTVTPSSGFSSEKVILVLARIDAVPTAQRHFDADEYVNSQLIRYEHLKELIQHNRVRAAQAVAAVGYYEMFYKNRPI
ncbi:NUDIX hydrolase [Pediococcus siamensis]|uniref:NUDIX hydrolase n=1 Tax=Pediococcus siamensis TaxID=381829 RepID=UPI00399F23E5